MRRLVLFIVSLGCLGIILGGAGYADSRDQFRQTDLHSLYQNVNRTSFEGRLPDVAVSWGDLSKDDSYGITHFNKEVPYSMELDRGTVRSESFALDVIRHESCHIATIHEVKRLKENPHGATFAECMSRIQENEKTD